MQSIIFGGPRNNEPSRHVAFSFQKRIRRVAVIGGGPVALSWAAYYLSQGFDVVTADPVQGSIHSSRQYVNDLLGAVLLERPRAARRGTLRLVSELDEALLRADFVQECDTRNARAKIELLVEIDKCTRPDSIIASDAASGIINSVQGTLHFGDRYIIARSPDLPHLNPLTYVVAHPGTSPLAIKQAMKFYTHAERLPIFLQGEVSEEFADRLLVIFRREAAQLRELDIISKRDLREFGGLAPSLCCGALISAMQPDSTSQRAVLHNSNHAGAAVAFEHSGKTFSPRDKRLLGGPVSASPVCVP